MTTKKRGDIRFNTFWSQPEFDALRAEAKLRCCTMSALVAQYVKEGLTRSAAKPAPAHIQEILEGRFKTHGR